MTEPYVIVRDEPQSDNPFEAVPAVIAKPPCRIKFKRTSTNVIMATAFEPIKWVVPGYISEGFLVLGGRQKLGKTWLAIDLSIAVAIGDFTGHGARDLVVTNRDDNTVSVLINTL